LFNIPQKRRHRSVKIESQAQNPIICSSLPGSLSCTPFGRKKPLLSPGRLFYADDNVLLPSGSLQEARQAQKLCKFHKKIIARTGFDDYYKKFTCKG
jgi:hypothetical protein